MSELQESGNSAVDLAALDYLRGVKSSTCLLLPTTPSPTSLHINHPLSDQMADDAYLGITEDSMVSLQNVDLSAGDSSSSADSNSVVQDPVSAQLINNISMLDYQTLSKTGDMIVGPTEDGKLNGNFNASNKLPSFVNWNWNIIRTVLLWVVISALMACIAAIVAMTVTIPKSCNPDLPWYQGKVFYEVFPASFKDSNKDGVGDLKGLISKLDYIEDLGISALRLNYIFEANNYPERYYNITSLLNIDRSVGTLNDFKDLVNEIHKRNMSIILDIPVLSMAEIELPLKNVTDVIHFTNDSISMNVDETSKAIVFWAKIQGVDGFYLKNLVKYVNDPNFGKSLQFWKYLIGHNKILVSDEAAYKEATGDALNVLLSRIDLIDVTIDLLSGIDGLKTRVEEVISSSLWSQPHCPWVLWNIGNLNSKRVSTRHENNTLVLLTLEFVLPGTINIFYGDEIGLGDIPLHNIEKDFHDHEIVKNLVPMTWSDGNGKSPILSWNSYSHLKPHYHYLGVLKSLIDLRLNTPTIYLRSIYKEGNMLKNTEVKKSEDNLVIIERWYPRRNTCVFVGNLGNVPISTDLSSMFYGGMVVASTNTSLIGQILYLEEITLPPYSAIILKLEK